MANGRVAVSILLVAAALLEMNVAAGTLARGRQDLPSPQCRVHGTTTTVAELVEGSGAAASRRYPGRIWAHNDSGEPAVVALDARGMVLGRVQLTGAQVEDWEAAAVGPCPAGSCLYIGDIGDNGADRERITVYRVPEPAAVHGTVAIGEVFHARYPDGPHDAEALFVTPDGDIFIVTKGETGPVALYRFPRSRPPGRTVTLERVGRPREGGEVDRDERITDAAVSPDGRWMVLRTRDTLLIHPAVRLAAGDWREAARVDLEDLDEPQGEGVTFGDDTTLMLVGEGGGKSRPGTFARVTCSVEEDEAER